MSLIKILNELQIHYWQCWADDTTPIQCWAVSLMLLLKPNGIVNYHRIWKMIYNDTLVSSTKLIIGGGSGNLKHLKFTKMDDSWVMVLLMNIKDVESWYWSKFVTRFVFDDLWNLIWKLNDKVDQHDQSWGHQDDRNVSGYLQVAD